jgi:pre-mRNA-splicing helicase BRR2
MAYLDVTVEVYTLSLKESTKLKGLLEVVSSSAEFENIPIRRHEDALLRRVYDRVPVKLDRVDFDAPHFKTFLLLQAHFSRLQLPPDLAADQALVLEKILNLLSACVDVMSSNAWLNATRAMDLSQMCVQAMWDTESPLKQVPHFEPDVSAVVLAIWSRIVSNVSYQVIKRCKEANVESVYDIMEMEDDQRSDLLRMDARQM